MNATSRVRRPMSRDSHVAYSVLDNSKKAAKNVAVYVRKNKQADNASANVIWTPVSIKLNDHNTRSSEKPLVSVKKWVLKLPSCPCVVSSCVTGSSDRSVGC
ncbi:hypothetical protein Tco_0330596, partial [Tanacetum coccineum]